MVAGPDPYTQDPNDPWWVAGWTVQNRQWVSPDSEPAPSPYPADIPMVNVVATYMDDEGTPVRGRLLVRPNASYRADGASVLPRVRPYDVVHGQLDIVLPASDSTALEASFTYTVREAFAGGRQFAISVPEEKSGIGPVEIHSLMVDDRHIIPISSVPARYGWTSPVN